MVERDLDKLKFNYGAEIDEEAFGALQSRLESDPKVKVASGDHRIFPGYYAPVIILHHLCKSIVPMRYSAYHPSYLSPAAAKGLSTFNARKDSLDKRFWSEAFGVGHGFVVTYAFYEWVPVRQLLKAGKVTMEQVVNEFNRQAEERRQNWLAKGKDLAKIKPTKTERKNPLERDIMVMFKPVSGHAMLLPVIYSCHKTHDDRGFAIITDEPNPEIRLAGHDRMPISLSHDSIEAWLNPADLALARRVLDDKRDATYQHFIPGASS